MENIINFKTFSSINESVDPNATNIIIGDSLCPLLAAKITNASLLSRDSGEKSLWKGGMGVSWLKDAVSKYRISPNIQNVVVNIGTNGGFKLKDDIKGLYDQLKKVFPNARFFQIQGSWGWGGNTAVTLSKVTEYYKVYQEQGAILINPPIGYSATDREAHSNRPVLVTIGAEVDRLIKTPGKSVSSNTYYSNTTNKPEVNTGSPNVTGGVISRQGDSYKYKVENDHWMAKRDNQTNWYEITGKDFKPGYESSIEILDTENPSARTQKAPKRKGAVVDKSTNDNNYDQNEVDQIILPIEKGADPTKIDPKISKEFNFYIIPDGKGTNYRSAQFPIKHMKNMYIKYGIKRVIRFNHDGGDSKHGILNKGVSVAEEKKLCEEIGIEFFKLSSTKDQQKVNDLLAKGNTLVHCAHGADRTGGNVGGYFYSSKVNPALTTTEAIWQYTTQYNGWNRMAKNRPKSFESGGYLKQAQKFGVRDMDHAKELAIKYKKR